MYLIWIFMYILNGKNLNDPTFVVFSIIFHKANELGTQEASIDFLYMRKTYIGRWDIMHIYTSSILYYHNMCNCDTC